MNQNNIVCVYVCLLFTQGGLHLFKLIDTYGPSGTNLLLIACFETLVIAWVYGKLLQKRIICVFGSLIRQKLRQKCIQNVEQIVLPLNNTELRETWENCINSRMRAKQPVKTQFPYSKGGVHPCIHFTILHVVPNWIPMLHLLPSEKVSAVKSGF